MKQNKNILRAALLLLLVIAAPEVRAQQLITDNGDGTYTITMTDHNVTVTADVKKVLTHKDISVTIPRDYGDVYHHCAYLRRVHHHRWHWHRRSRHDRLLQR